MKANLRDLLSRLPMKWKMVLWSSFILFVLFVAYNGAQFFAIDHWLNVQERMSIQMQMTELQSYFQENKADLDAEHIRASVGFLEKMNERKQRIRILDNGGDPIVTVANRLPSDWEMPHIAGDSVLISVWRGEDHMLVMRSPLVGEHFKGTIEIVSTLEIEDHLSGVLWAVMVGAGIGALLLSGLGGLMLAKQLLKPLRSFAATIRSIQQRGLHERVVYVDNNDELAHLAKQFNALMDQLQASFVQQQQFVEDASHELRTPLAIMKGHLSLLDRWGKSDPNVLNLSLAATLQEFQRMEGIVQELLTLTRSESAQPAALFERVQPDVYIRQAVERFSALHPHMTFETELDALAGSMLEIVPHQLEQIMFILLDNAVKYSADRPLVRVSGMKTGRTIRIAVTDYGIGIAAEHLSRVFDRFYRIDKARSRERGGTGLGLAIAKRLAERNRGEIAMESAERSGTTVTLTFPAV